jgi:predicted helicase
MKATTLLEQQHKKVKAIFKKLESGRTDAGPLLTELANDLVAHMSIEHELFYPAVVALDHDLISEAFEEHALAEIALKRLLSTDPEDDSFKARVVAAKELIEHHVKEEEEEMFPKAEKSKLDMQALGEKMAKRKQELSAGS